MTKKHFDLNTINRVGMKGPVSRTCKCGGNIRLLSESFAQIYVELCEKCATMTTEFKDCTDRKNQKYPNAPKLTKFQKVSNHALRKPKSRSSLPKRTHTREEENVVSLKL